MTFIFNFFPLPKMRICLLPACLLIISFSSYAFAADAANEAPFPAGMKFSIEGCEKPAYPLSALRNRMSGDTLLAGITDAEGKVASVDVVRSSGWRNLDFAAARSIVGCTVTNLTPGKPVHFRIPYRWTLEETKTGSFTPPLLLPESCPASDLVRLPGNDEAGLGIVIGAVVAKNGTVSRHSVEWADDDNALTQEAVRFIKACKFAPGVSDRKNITESVISVRLLPKKPAVAAAN